MGADHLIGSIAEQLLGRGAEGFYDSAIVDDDHGRRHCRESRAIKLFLHAQGLFALGAIGHIDNDTERTRELALVVIQESRGPLDRSHAATWRIKAILITDPLRAGMGGSSNRPIHPDQIVRVDTVDPLCVLPDFAILQAKPLLRAGGEGYLARRDVPFEAADFMRCERQLQIRLGVLQCRLHCHPL